MNLAVALIGSILGMGVSDAPLVRIAYFVPTDRQPIGGYVGRLDRVMTEVQRFYRDGMAAAGYGPKTFCLERGQQGRLQVHLVRGQHPMRAYGRQASDAVRGEVKTALAREGIDVDRQTLVIFQALLAWEGNTAIEVGPYVGSGNHLSGTAWVYDDERLDPLLLASKAPGGYYGRPCSLGEFNSHYIGGLAHELGHAFGLPHDCERQAERSTRGRSLMGGGNHTYGQEKRGEGAGTFLSAGSAMLLAYSRPFAGEQPQAARKPACRLRSLDASFQQGQLVLTGTLEATPAASGIVAFDDWAKIPGDYDAVSWTCTVDSQGRFLLGIGEMRPGQSQLRLRICHVNGATSRFAFDYEVDSHGSPDLWVFRAFQPLNEAVAAYAAKDWPQARTLATRLLAEFSGVRDVQRRAAHLLTLIEPEPPRALAELPVKEGWVSISNARFRSAVTGWGPPLRDQAPIEEARQCFLQVGSKFYTSGLYAHAPSSYQLALARTCSRFRTAYGLQDGHDGSAVFVVRTDGQELFRSSLIKDHVVRDLEVDLRGKELLELSVEDGGDGNNSDWGVWLLPQVKRSDGGQR